METIQAKSCEQCLAKSPNKHNRLLMTAEPLQEELVLRIEKEDIFPSQDVKARAKILVTDFEFEDDHARKIWGFGPIGNGPNLFIDSTKAIQYLIEIKDHCISAFQELTKAGPLSFEEQRGVRYSLWDATLHTDSIHRGANQVSPATRTHVLLVNCQLNHVSKNLFSYVKLLLLKMSWAVCLQPLTNAEETSSIPLKTTTVSS